MLTPTRIEVRNVRSIAHAVVEPLTDGITALNGAAGSGKSTVVNSMLWALYGEVGGISGLLVQAEARRAGSPAGEPAEVTVDFTVNDDEYRVVRRLHQRSRNGKTVEVASADLWVNGTKQPQITPSTVTRKITDLTGLSGRAFAGAFFVAQFHLPTLAEGTPGEVQRVIEDQTGLTPLTRKIDQARGEARDAQTQADALPGSQEEVDAARQEVDAAQQDGTRLWTDFETAQQREQKTREVWERTRDHHERLAAQSRAAQQAQVKAAEHTARLETLAEQIRDLEAQAADLPQVDTEQVQARANELREVIHTARQAQHQVAAAADTVSDAQAHADRADQAAHGWPDDLDTQRDTAQQRVQQLHAELGAVQGEYTRLTRAVEAIRAAGRDTASCPTCAQPLPDTQQLLDDLIAQTGETERRGRDTRQQVDTAQAATDRLVQQTRDRDRAVQQHQEALAAVSTATRKQQQTQQQARQTLDRLAGVTGGDPTTAPGEAIEQAQQQLDTVAAQLATAEQAGKVRQTLRQRRHTYAQVEADLHTAQAAAADTVADEDLEAAQTAARDAQVSHGAEERARQEAETAATVAAERVRAAESARDRAQQTLNSKVDALTRADTLRHATGLLAALRRDLLADYTSTISASATDLMQQVGGGDHVGVVLGEDFVPKVVLATGEERPMRVLSGGEKMRAALCLRLGIADQITGSTGAGTVVADEITANLDEATTQMVVDLIRNLGRPMVVIAHAPEVTQIANRVFQVTKSDETTGTRVRQAGWLPQVPAGVAAGA